MKAIVLLGGLGTRLRSVVPNLPKPMAPIHGKPFLAYLLDYLKSQGITEVIFSVHYLREKIYGHFRTNYEGITIHYAEEDKLLGTGGAIKFALSIAPPLEPVFVLNGDTLVKCDYHAMYAQHNQTGASLTMALRSVDDCARYGKVITEQGRIVDFREKGEAGAGQINAGVYLADSSLFDAFDMPAEFSFEKDFFVPHLAAINAHAFMADGYFIDIGIPQDYERAQAEFEST